MMVRAYTLQRYVIYVCTCTKKTRNKKSPKLIPTHTLDPWRFGSPALLGSVFLSSLMFIVQETFSPSWPKPKMPGTTAAQ